MDKEWSADKASKIKGGNAKQALRETIADAVNAAQFNNLLSLDWANAYYRVINGYAMDGIITSTEAGELQAFLMSLVLDRLEKKRF